MSVIHVHCESSNHPQADISHFKSDRTGQQAVVRKSREAIHIWIKTKHSIVILVNPTSQKYSMDF